MKRTFKFKKGEKVFDKKRKEVIEYVNRALLIKGTNEIIPVFKKDTKLIIEIK